MKVFLLFAAYVTFPALASACASFVGSWAPIADQSTPPVFEGVTIEYYAPTSVLTVTYNTQDERSRQFTETYVTDSRSHPGDGRSTGTSYTATCTGDQLVIRRLGMLIKPCVSTFTLRGERLELVTQMEGDPHSVHEVFARE